MATIANLAVSITARTAGLKKGLKDAKKLTDHFGAGMGRLAGAGGAVGAAFVALTKQQADAADQIRDASIRTGASTESLSQLQYAAKLADVSFDSLTSRIERLQSASVKAAAGDKKLGETFAALGIDAKKFERLKPEDKLFELADAFAQVQDSGQRIDLARNLFGRSGGGDMLKLFEGGAEGLQRSMDEAASMGLTVTDPFAQSADTLNDSVTKITEAFNGLGRLLSDSTLPTIAVGLQTVANTLPGIIQSVAAAFQGVGTGIGGAAAGLGELLKGNFGGAMDIFRNLGSDVSGAVQGSLDRGATPVRGDRPDKAVADNTAKTVAELQALNRNITRGAPAVAN